MPVALQRLTAALIFFSLSLATTVLALSTIPYMNASTDRSIRASIYPFPIGVSASVLAHHVLSLGGFVCSWLVRGNNKGRALVFSFGSKWSLIPAFILFFMNMALPVVLAVQKWADRPSHMPHAEALVGLQVVEWLVLGVIIYLVMKLQDVTPGVYRKPAEYLKSSESMVHLRTVESMPYSDKV